MEETKAPPLPDPLLHPMEERERLVAASPRCAVSQNSILQRAGSSEGSGGGQRAADCKSAIRQSATLRYGLGLLSTPCWWWCRVVSVVLRSVGCALLLASQLSIAGASSAVVLGFERLQSNRPTDLREAGELLLGELGCVNCHAPAPRLAERVAPQRGRKLDLASSQLRTDYIGRLLEDPQAAHPGTKMPSLLAGFAPVEKQQAIQAITAFLSASAVRSQGISTQELSGSIEKGRQLYHALGCTGCHAPETGYRPEAMPEDVQWQAPSAPSVALEHVRGKYLPGGLARFLKDPLSVRPAARMPDFRLTAQEAADLEAYLMRGQTSTAQSLVPPDAHSDQTLVQLGREWFERLACLACHDLGNNGPSRSVDAKPLVELRIATGEGCGSGQPSSRRPQYSLSEAQRAALHAALDQMSQPVALTPAERVARRMTALHCYACHERDTSGPEAARSIYFASNAEDLGDEGRLPPRLTGVGAKLLPEAIHAILLGQGSVRPYMITRMPNFGSDHARHFAQHFAEADFDPRVKPTARVTNPGAVGRNSAGRDLIGDKGLSCISCHPLNGKRSLGIQAVDLANAPKRLRPEWFRDYLLDPAKFRPSTKMPSFWPDGKSMVPGVGGNTERQIDNLWVYLNEIDQSRWPSGMEEIGNFELIPTNRPIVFRTFMKRAGMHAVAVGFPEKLHAAFDSKQVRWAMVWKGKFLDAESTWDNRFTPLTAPLGEHILPMPEGPAFARLNSLDEAWPRDGGRAAGGLSFRGYRLDQSGSPTFLYQFGDVEITDCLKPSSGDGQGFVRTIHLRQGSGEAGGLWFRAALAERPIEQDGDGFVIDQRWVLSAPNPKPILRNQGGRFELVVSIHFENGQATITEKIQW